MNKKLKYVLDKKPKLKSNQKTVNYITIATV